MKYTKSQLQAIEETGNLLVAAAAGAGKTAVLTQRIINLIIKGADIERMLVVTFTNAAAAQMKKRIESKLREALLQQEDKVLIKRLQDQLDKVQSADISTIHAFCIRVLRRNFHAIGLDPRFAVADGIQVAALKEDALNEVLEHRFEAKDPDFLQLYNLFGSEEQLVDAVLTVYEHMQSHPEPLEWLSRSCAFYGLSPEELKNTKACNILLQEAKEALIPYEAMLQQERDDLIEDAPNAADALTGDLINLQKLLSAEEYDIYREILQSFSFDTMRFPGDFDGLEKKRIQGLRDKVKKVIRTQKEGWFLWPLDEEAEIMSSIRPAVQALESLLKDFCAAYEQLKSESRVVDFSDLEHKTLNILKQPEIAAFYQNYFEHIFVDEYQDINRVQEAILSRLSNDSNRFIVGDVKQSIYRFRLADPTLFLEKFEKFGNNNGGKRIDLSSNFRSAPQIIDFVNQVFGCAMCESLGDIDYQNGHQLIPGRTEGDGSVELHLIDSNYQPDAEEEEEQTDQESLEGAALTAMHIAKRVQEMVQKETFVDPETGQERRFCYGDCAVLLRATRASALAYAQVFAMEGIPAYAELTGGYFDAMEVAVLLNLLRLIDNKHQDIPLASVLRSPIGNFEAEELFAIRQACKDGSFHQAFYEYAKQDDALGQKVKGFLDRLEGYRNDAKVYGLEALIGYLMEDTGYYEFVGTLPNGPARQENLNELLRRANSFEQGGNYTISGFLHFLDRAQRSDGIETPQTGGMDVVRIMSIHKSKGLEFPVVIVAGLERKFNTQSLVQKVLPDGELGIGLKVDQDQRRLPTLYHRAISQKLLREDYSEEMRLLYVALTRAKERLLLFGSVKNAHQYIRRHHYPPMPGLLQKEQCFLGWLIPVILAQPCGSPLRESIGIGDGESGGIGFYLHSTASGKGFMSMMQKSEYQAWKQEALSEKSDEELLQALRWKYPYSDDVKILIKQSVTGLAREEAPISFRTPDFLQEQRTIDALELGSATHRLLEMLPIKEHTVEDIKEQLDRWVSQGIWNSSLAEMVDVTAAQKFFSSHLGKRIIASREVHREWKFLWIPDKSYQEQGFPAMLQGIIDCCFLEGEEWVLVDYKTDRITGDLNEAAQKHSHQLQHYAVALKELTEKPVKEMYIYFLSVNEAVRIC